MPAANREQRRKAGRSKTKGAVIRITVDEKVYVLDIEKAMDEVSPQDAAQVRKACGISLRALFTAAKDDPDLDTIAALVFLAMRQEDPVVTFDDACASIGYNTKLDFEDESDQEPATAKPTGKHADAIPASVLEDGDPET